MAVAVFRRQFFSGDVAMLDNVIDKSAGALRGDGLQPF